MSAVTSALSYGETLQVALPYDAAISATKDALAAEGFGVLTEILATDVRARLVRALNAVKAKEQL